MNPEKKTPIGWIGTGVMGRAMCARLQDAGYPVFVHTRTRAKAEALERAGAVWCETPAELAEQCRTVFTLVGYPADVEEVVLGEQGVLQTLPPDSILVDMTTSEPSLARRIYDVSNEQGIAALDVPVSGGDVGAREGTLAMMVGGDLAVYESVLPLLKVMGEIIVYMGEPGMGQHTKMCNQILIASTMIGVVESLIYAVRSGLEPGAVIDVIGRGAASSWSINNLGRRIVAGHYDPGFFIKHFVKDMGIALNEARHMNLSLPGLALAHQFYLAAMAEGLEDLGTQGLYQVIERLNGAG